MKDEEKITEDQSEQANGGSGFAVPDKIPNCPRCSSDNVIFDKSEYNLQKGQMTYHYWCRDCGNRFQGN